MKRISSWISMILAVCMLLSVSAFAAPSFTDVQSGDWFYEAVNYCVEQGMVNGMSPTTFAPQGTMTRAQFVTILGRMDGFDTKPYSGYAAFSDESADTWYTPYINWAAKIGVTDGVTPTTFAPDANVTREQVATFVARYLNLKCLRLQDDAKPAAAFPDSGSISTWAKDAVESMRLAGLLRGNDKGLVQPGKNMTRAEGATFLMRLHQALASAAPNHAWGETQVKTEPTCQQEGSGTHTCTRCGITEDVVLEKLPHTFPEWTVIEPTCEKMGMKSRICEVCGELDAYPIPALGHDWNEGVVVKEFTCTEDGLITYTCKRDETHTREAIVPAHHLFGEWVQTKAPTCDEFGEECSVCSVCGEKHSFDIPMIAHNLKHIDGIAATCKAPGMKETWKCENCGKAFLDEDGETPATEENSVIPALDHQWEEVHENRSLPIYDLQEHEFCDVCHADLTAMDYADVKDHLQSHDASEDGYMKLHVEYVPVENGTLDYTVLTGYKCKNCGDTKNAETHSHDYILVSDEVELPTYEMKKVVRCSLCDADCTNMTDEEWLEHFDSHGMVPNGKFSIRYDSWEYVQTGTIKQKANIGYACNGCEESISFKVLKPEYKVERVAGDEWVIRFNRCNACNAILTAATTIDGKSVILRDLDDKPWKHQSDHMDKGEPSGYHSDRSREVVSWITTRTLTQFK